MAQPHVIESYSPKSLPYSSSPGWKIDTAEEKVDGRRRRLPVVPFHYGSCWNTIPVRLVLCSPVVFQCCTSTLLQKLVILLKFYYMARFVFSHSLSRYISSSSKVKQKFKINKAVSLTRGALLMMFCFDGLWWDRGVPLGRGVNRPTDLEMISPPIHWWLYRNGVIELLPDHHLLFDMMARRCIIQKCQ